MAMIIRRFRLLTALLLTAAAHAATPLLPLEVFFGNSQISQLQISPDGRYLAMLQPVNNRMNITVIDRQQGTKRRLTNMREENVVSISWLNNHRLGFRQQVNGQESFGFYAIEADGSKLSVLQQLVALEGETVVNQPEQQYSLVDALPDDPDHILVSINRGRSGLGDLYRQNIITEKFTKVMTNPGSVRSWLTDRTGVARVGISQMDKAPTAEVLYRASAKSPWVTIHTGAVDGDEWTPLGFDGDNKTLYVRSNQGRSTAAIYTYDPVAEKITGTVFADDTYDAGDIIYSRHLQKVVGVSYEGEKPSIYWIDPKMKQLAADIDAALPGMHNDIVSATRDYATLIINSRSDRDPGTFFLLDTVKMELSTLLRVNERVDPAQMAVMRPIEFKARDGLLLHGYLTLPAGREPRGLPLIINPHGGPYGPRDSWRFNPEIQFLANRGYAVLQINYRGSGGYGARFEEAGYRQWGRKMQDDLTDGVQWAVAQGYADAARIGIYGASYGGYAALAGLVYTPELYQIGINYVGVSDISRLGLMLGFRSADTVRQKFIARRWLNPDIDGAEIKAVSPINYIENIRVPSLHAYGRYDPRVTKDQGEVLEARLKATGKKYQYISVENEGHGFNKFENRMAFYGTMDAFLRQYLPAEKIGNVIIAPMKILSLPAQTP